MANEEPTKEITVKPGYGIELRGYENQLLGLLHSHGLPTEGFLLASPAWNCVYKCWRGSRAHQPRTPRQLCICFKVCCSGSIRVIWCRLKLLMGWDDLELRRRVARYDLSFFYDNAITSPDRRKEFSGEADLSKISDSELIYGAKEIELISEVGFKHLDYIRFMRNWVSAAHPNQNEITGLQLISWLETCMKEVISLPLFKYCRRN